MVAFSVSNFANVAYPPADQTAYVATSTCGERLSVTYPTGTPANYRDIYGEYAGPLTPWKYLLIIQQSGGSPGTSSTAPSSSFDSVNGFPDDVLIRGLAIVEAQLTSFAVGNTQVPGLGAMHHPGGIEGHYESRNHPNPLKDIVFVIQHLRYNSLVYSIRDPRSYKLDDWFALYGANSAFLVPWCGSAPSRACELGNGGVYEMNTVPNFIVSNAVFPYDYILFRQNESAQGGWFPAVESGGAGVDDQGAASLAAAPQRYVRGLGSRRLISDHNEPCHPKTFAFGNTGPENLSIGEPLIPNRRKFKTGVHDSGHILHLRAALPPGTVEVRLSPAAQRTLSDSQMTSTALPASYFDGQLATAPTGHVAPTGRVTFTGVPSDGDLLTISDGITTIIFEWDSNSSVAAGHTAIAIGGAATPTDAGALLVTAVNGSGLFLFATNAAGVVAIPSTHTDIAGNATWTCTGTVMTTRGPASFGIVTIGTNPADGDTLTLDDGVRSVIFEFDNNAAVTAGSVLVTIGGSTTVTMTNLKKAILACGLGLSWNNSATATNTVTLTINGNGDVGSSPTWSSSVLGTKITLSQPTGGGTSGGQSLTADDEWTGPAILALVKAAKNNYPRWDAQLPPRGIRRAGQVAPMRIPALGSISFTGNPADGNTLTISDGVTSIIFEFDSGGVVTAGNRGVQIGATAAATMTNLLAEIGAAALLLTWVPGIPTTSLTNFTSSLIDGVPNVTWTNVGANITVTGLSGGLQGRPRCIVPPPNGNGRTGIRLRCMSLSGDSDLLYGPSEDRCLERLRPGEDAWVTYSKLWACSAGGGSQVALYEARECDERSK